MPIFTIHLFGITISPSYYGAMYALGFLIAYHIIKYRKRLELAILDDLLLAIFIGVIVGGRLGYVLIYNPSYYLAHPGEIIAVWQGGMSFHGGLLWVLLATWIFWNIKKIAFLRITDELALAVPIAIGLGRIGNYINGELLGFAPYNWPLAVIVNGVSHFPSSLLEAFLEGPILLIILILLSRKSLALGSLGACFLIGYGALRCFVEFFRLPDTHIGYLAGTTWMTMGHVLCACMIIVGGMLLMFFESKQSRISTLK